VDEFGQTIIMVTHDEEAAAYADRLLVLRDGRLVEDRVPSVPAVA
jgi:putative ABC transport system ATP-binding protein